MPTWPSACPPSQRFGPCRIDIVDRHYKETPSWWYAIVLVISFALGLVIVKTESITLPVRAYIVALPLGAFVSPLVGLGQVSVRVQADGW
jgi:hypothetical protein